MLKEGIIIESSLWKEPIEVKKVEEGDGFVRIIGATLYSKEHIDQVLFPEEVEKIKIKEHIIDFSASGNYVFLSLEAFRYTFASLFDPLLAMNTSKIDPLPHQIEAVYGYILKLPHIRFLLADDPGAGKTIMAGLIIKELKHRRLANRILIVVPGHLKDQWRRELKEKFQESFTVIDKGFLDAHYAENVWHKEFQVITSIDFAKQDEVLPSLNSTDFDLVIVDEAHKMAAYRYGEKISRTSRYKLGENLSKVSDHLLFLTATPHKGDPENFRLFLDLLMPGFFATTEMVDDSLKNKDNPLFIRRMKEDLQDFDGRPLFPPRHVKTMKFKLSEDEKRLYNELSEYVITEYNKALQNDKRRNVAFALLILQRRMASSTYALYKSLERRKHRLEELLNIADSVGLDISLKTDIEEIEDFEEEVRWQEEEKWETLTIAKNREELKKEIDILERLINKSKEILKNEEEIKLSELKKVMESIGKEKIIIFTESRDTMDYLVKKIKVWGYSVNSIHGGMKLEERVEAEKVFKNQTQVMVATEAAGEGINLQFCHLMINYDIPWNPNRLEQRMGRIHRYGQQKEVFVFNLVAEDTREGMVLTRLFDKLEEIKRAVGSDRVFDVIGEVFYGKKLSQLILEAYANARSIDEILKDLEIKVDEDYIREVKESLGESLATRFIDYTQIKEMAEKAKEYKLIPEYTEEFSKRVLSEAGGKYKIRKDGFLSVDSVPYDLKKIADEINFKNRYGTMLKSYPKVTFDKDFAFKNPDVEFIAFGHPLFEAQLEWVKRTHFDSLKRGAVFSDPSGRFNGYIWFFEGEVKDGKGDIAGKRLFAFYDDGSHGSNINPSILWDLVPEACPVPRYGNGVTKLKESSFQVDNEKSKVQTFAISSIKQYREELFKERIRQANIKERYGIKSLEYLINKLDMELVELYERQQRGEDVNLPLMNKEERKKGYESALKNLREEIEREKNLTISMPELIGIIKVRPVLVDDSMVSEEEIEAIGMKVAIEYEKNQGRQPEDVSKENLGYDLRSKPAPHFNTGDENETRYIEVKARKNEGAIALTQNEWFKAKRFRDQYYLYIVTNANTTPALYIIQNPAEKIEPVEKVEVVRFIIKTKEWKDKSEKIDEG